MYIQEPNAKFMHTLRNSLCTEPTFDVWVRFVLKNENVNSFNSHFRCGAQLSPLVTVEEPETQRG